MKTGERSFSASDDEVGGFQASCASRLTIELTSSRREVMNW